MSTGGDGRHVSDEELSDLVDGAAGDGVDEHVAGCPSCAARLDGWRSVSRRLGSLGRSSPVPAGGRDDAVAAAMAAAATGAGAGARTGGRRGSPARSASASPSRSPSPSPGSRGRRDLGRLAGLAAAAAAVAGVAVGVAHLGHHPTVKSADRGAATARGSSGSASPTSGASSAGAPFAAVPSAAGAQSGAGVSSSGAAAGGARPLRGDFGSLGGPAAVAAAAESALGSGTGAEGGSISVAPASGAPASAAPASAAPASAAPAVGGTAASCPATAKLFPGTSPRLLLVASAIYRGTPAEVYAYRVGADRWAVVVSSRGCALLADIALTAGSS